MKFIQISGQDFGAGITRGQNNNFYGIGDNELHIFNPFTLAINSI